MLSSTTTLYLRKITLLESATKFLMFGSVKDKIKGKRLVSLLRIDKVLDTEI